MAPGKIVRYTETSGSWRWDAQGIDVSASRPLDIVAPDVADLVHDDPNIPLEKYVDADINTNISPVDGLDIKPETADADLVSTRHSIVDNLSATPVTPANPRIQNQKRDWSWEDITWEDKGSPIIDGSASASPDGATYPTIINAEEALASPIDTYYCYWSGHDAGAGIELSTAPSLWGPWTFHGRVISDTALGDNHVASPSAVVDSRNSRLNLYVHSPDGGSQDTYLMTAPLSGDGTSFTLQKKVLKCSADGRWDEQERSYFSVRRIGRKFVGVYQGRDGPNNAPGIGVAWSMDGENWETKPSPAFDNTQWQNYAPREYNGGSPALSSVGGRVAIHYGDRAGPHARALPFSDHEKTAFGGGEVVYSPPAWADATGVNAYDFYNDGEYLHMFYYAKVSNNSNIGVARAKLGEINQ
ncbi:hypothetical protein [Halopelagius fulvigenes]|uniref:Uncharacterized protein n=1 Tax=Halopelagius fulvigenes TaxID=1198324 RepID=A0ABD5TYK9_9EURY